MPVDTIISENPHYYTPVDSYVTNTQFPLAKNGQRDQQMLLALQYAGVEY